MELVKLTHLLRSETRKALQEAFSAEEKAKFRELGSKLADWADKKYQKDLRQAKDDRELRDLAETDLKDYHKIADLLKNGDALSAGKFLNKIDTAAAEEIPNNIYNTLMGVQDREMAKLDLDTAVKMFETSFAYVKRLILAGKYEDAAGEWDDLVKLESVEVTDLLEDLAKDVL